MKAKTVFEGMFDDIESQKALASYAKAFITKDYDDYEIEVPEPFSIIVSSEDKHKLQYLFNKYKVPFKVKTKETDMQ